MAAQEAQFVACYRVSTERQGESGLGLTPSRPWDQPSGQDGLEAVQSAGLLRFGVDHFARKLQENWTTWAT
jgi:hypothetical protein